jgi:undecaprenyl-diphosphatase
VAAVGYLVLTVLVATDVTQPLDDAIRQRFRPDDSWGTAQATTTPLIDALEPRRVFALLAVLGIAISIRRRSWRPVAFTAVVAVTATVLTSATKYALHRPDPHSEVFGGGSFPSGHVLSDLVCLGGAVLLLQRRTRWWTWALVGLVGVSMGLALLFSAAHWFTDVAGGALLAVVVLSVAAVLPRQQVPGEAPAPAPISSVRSRSAPPRPGPRGARRPPSAPRTTR